MTQRDRPRTSYTLLFGGGIVAVLLASAVLVVWVRGNQHQPNVHRLPSPASETTEPPAQQATYSAPVPLPTLQPTAALPNPQDPIPPDADIGDMPPPETAQSTTDRPPRKDFTEDEKHQKRVEALAMVDREIKRLEQELATLEKDGKTQEAAALKVRVDRMRKLREKRAAQLEGDAGAGTGDEALEPDAE